MSHLTQREETKLDTIRRTLARQITNETAGKILHISVRQVKRLKKQVRQNGEEGIIHKLKGRTSNHHIEQVVKNRVLTLIKQTYPDFKPTFATEKLEEDHDIRISYGTTRLWMIQEGLWKPRFHKKVTYRSWRPRKEYYGELQQFDGSYHHWFENRYCDEEGNPIEVCMLAAIDDATGKITHATFSANEGVVAVFEFWKSYILKYGKPLAIYLDSFSTYKISHKSAVDNTDLMTQFQRTMRELGITLITAHSPQAKGRVERLFGTLQDRLVKEMRLAGINTPKEGNTFLEVVFLKKFNDKFSVTPTKEGNVHKPLSGTDRKNLNRIFSVQQTRKIRNDFTIQFKNKWYQLLELQPTTVRPRETVTIEEWLDGTVHLNLKDNDLSYMVLPQRPQGAQKQPAILTTHRLNWKPPLNHPWRTPKG